MLFHHSKLPTELKVVDLNKKLTDQQSLLSQRTHLKVGANNKKLLNRIYSKLKAKNNQKTGGVTFVIDFKGDVQAAAVSELREVINLILSMAKPGVDKVLLRLESPGGVVHGYGLAAAQLVRLRDAEIELTVCVDKVAASGGYMMACVANQIVAAPFAVVGSIGVVAQLPNFHRLLKENQVDYTVYTAGEHKRTVTVFGENNEAGVEKFEQELEQTHQLFKHFVARYRDKIDINQVATGEHWFAKDGVDLQLVDQLQTSDEYILRAIEDNQQLYLIKFQGKPSLGEKLGLQTAQMADQILPTLFSQLENKWLQLQQNKVKVLDVE